MATNYGQLDTLARHRAAAVAGQAAGLASEVARLKARFVIKDSELQPARRGVGERKFTNNDAGGGANLPPALSVEAVYPQNYTPQQGDEITIRYPTIWQLAEFP